MKLKLLALALGVMLFASCSGDDDKGSSVNMDNLEKKWYPVSYKIGGQTVPYDDHEECGNDYIEFLAEGVFKEVDVWDCEVLEETGVYTVEGKTITTVVNGYTEIAKVKKLTATDLVVETTVPAMDGEQGMTFTANFKSSL